MKTREDFPVLMKRRHFVEDIGISDNVYYRLLHSEHFPVVRIGNNRMYVSRDAFFDMLEAGAIDYLQE